MKKILYKVLGALLLLLVLPFMAMSQEDNKPVNEFGGFDVSNPMNQQSSFGALLGYTDIGGEKFVGMRIQPEFVFGKLGFGLDIPFLFSVPDFKLRTDEYKDGVGLLRMIRYVSWGVKKRDPIYIRFGDLSDSYIGYGILLDNYTNSISFEKRKMGLSWDILVKNLVGVEGLYSDLDFTSPNLLALRPYVKPLGRTSIPVAKTLDIGFTFITDHDQTYLQTDSVRIQNNKFLDKGMKAWALDMGIIPINRTFLQLRAYMQYGKLVKNNSALLQDSIASYLTMARNRAENPISVDDSASIANYKGAGGFSIGVDLRLKAAGDVFRLDAKLERLWYKQYFMPQFFNASYEMNKDMRIFGLATANGKSGTYGALSITAMEKIMVGGSLMIPDNSSETNPAMLTLNLDASRLMEKFILTAYYIKGGLTGVKDAFKLDDRSLLSARVAYRMYKFLVIGMDYKWTWAKLEDGSFKTINYVSPYFGIQIPLALGKNKEPINFDNE
jgi:hypothetical protein